MLGYLIISLVGWYFFKLAKRYHKHTWRYAFIGAAVYFLTAFTSAFIIDSLVPDIETLLLGFLAVPLGLVAAWMLYRYLRKRFDDQLKNPYSRSDILDDRGF